MMSAGFLRRGLVGAPLNLTMRFQKNKDGKLKETKKESRGPVGRKAGTPEYEAGLKDMTDYMMVRTINIPQSKESCDCLCCRTTRK